MKRKFAAIFPVYLLSLLMAFFASCAQDGDGPLDVMPNGERIEGNGYFLAAVLDSGKTLHLISDTLYVTLSQIWSFSNCSLTSIDLNESVNDSVLVIAPKIEIKVNPDDCPAPMFRPDTTFKMVLKDLPSQVTNVIVKNDVDSLLDSIMLRRGKLERDTFRIFIDSAFAVHDSLPLRTKESPSVLRVLDSITPQKFFWRTLRANCSMRVDMCSDVVADTIYPKSWNVKDTALVPVRYACASADSVYCLNTKWEYDSAALGKVNERLDTIWHMSTYYVENIPSCAMMNNFAYGGFAYNSKATFVRELFVPSEDERSCGPSTKKDWIAYRLESNNILKNSDDGENKTQIDSLYKVWKSATVAPDTLRTDTTESK